MPAAIPLAIGAASTVGTVVAAKNNKKAIDKSTDAQLQANREAIAAQERAFNQGLQFQQNALDQSIGLNRDIYNSSGQLQTSIYNQNVARLDPYSLRGNAAGNQINAMLGLDTAEYSPARPVQFTPLPPPTTNTGATPAPAGTPTPTPAPAPPPSTAPSNAPMISAYAAQRYPELMAQIPAYARGTDYHPGGAALVGEQGPEIVNLPQGAQVIPNALMQATLQSGRDDRAARAADRDARRAGVDAEREARATARDERQQRRNDRLQGVGALPQAPGAPTANTTNTTGNTPANALTPQQTALNAFYDTPLYQFPLQRGLEAINANYAARGMLESGAAQKSLLDYGAGVAGGALGDYFGLLGNQQGVGLSAASAQAGIGQGYANSLTGLGSNYANSLSALNSNFANNASNLAGQLGGAIGQGAINTGNALSNQAMANANNNNGLISGLGNIFGSALGAASYTPYAASWSYNPMMS
jgi:hypothetical protein